MGYRQNVARVRNRIKNDDFGYDEQGRALVKINVSDADVLLSPFNDDGAEIVSEETATFINNITKTIPLKRDIHMQVCCPGYTESQEIRYKKALGNYYINEFAEKDRQLKADFKLAMIMILLALASFVLLYFIDSWNLNLIIYEFVSVVGWVFAWQATELLVLRRYIIRYEQRKILKIIFAEVSFKKLNTDKEIAKKK